MNAWMRHDSPLGDLLVVASERGICGLYFEQHKYFTGVQGKENPEYPLLRSAAVQLDEYFGRARTRFELPLDLRGTPFQLQVWEGLQQIPFGAVSTYGEQARQAGRSRAVRAVGAAIGLNPVCIIVPCHRVLSATGALTGYAGGLERKRHLLALEQRA